MRGRGKREREREGVIAAVVPSIGRNLGEMSVGGERLLIGADEVHTLEVGRCDLSELRRYRMSG